MTEHLWHRTGNIVPTGLSQPKVEVSVVIRFSTAEASNPAGQPITHKVATVCSLIPEKGATIAAGDYDLLVDADLFRLRRNEDKPEWLVLSSGVLQER